MNSKILQETSLRYFLEVVRCGSIAEASLKLNVASSAISRQIAHLESKLNVLLFERKTRGMKPTSAGEILAAYALKLQLDSERVFNEINALKGLDKGSIKIACSTGFSLDFLPSIIAKFQADYPGIQVFLHADSGKNVIKQLKDGTADIGVTFNHVPQSDISVLHRLNAPIYCIVTPQHELADRKNITLPLLETVCLALPPRGIVLRDVFDVRCSHQGGVIEPIFTSNTISAILSYVLAGGVTLSTELVLKSYLNQNLIKAIPLKDNILNNSLSIEVCKLSGRILPDAARVFLEYLYDELAVPEMVTEEQNT
ncbi:LysR family transcriptional regulator [Acinetobacter baumannii]|uniref:LysR family transcriptional regulator n=1 Tax=Acinetobacter baumannii TaxID=470 RepID=UPI001230BE18|nr:LysR family transcriptional regulator [Acinetobacter baumannii]